MPPCTTSKLDNPPPPPPPSSGRARRLARIGGVVPLTYPQKTFRPGAVVADGFTTTKREKRVMRRSVFVGRVQESGAIGKPQKKNKPRRPGNKLVTTLASLADALPDLDGDADRHVERGKIRHRSLPSKAGAMKRKEAVVRAEIQRFGVNMARLVGPSQAAQTGTTMPAPAPVPRGGEQGRDGMELDNGERVGEEPSATAGRWQALRGYIASTMEQNPAFIT